MTTKKYYKTQAMKETMKERIINFYKFNSRDGHCNFRIAFLFSKKDLRTIKRELGLTEDNTLQEAYDIVINN